MLIHFIYRSDNVTFPKELTVPLAIAKEYRELKTEKEEAEEKSVGGNTSQEVATIGVGEGVSHSSERGMASNCLSGCYEACFNP